MTTVYTIIFATLGATIGSFLSVVIHRVHSGEKGMLTGRSHCPNCKYTLKWYDLFPIFSWLSLGGKCRNKKCKKKISPIYPLLEIVTAALFAFIYLMAYPPLVTALYLILFSLTVAIFFYDILFMEIPDRFSLTAIIIALIIASIHNPPSIQSALIGAIGGFLFFFIQFALSKGRWIGGGDLRLGALLGAALGWQLTLVALFLAYLIGSIVCLSIMKAKKLNTKSQVPFGPFLLSGFYIAFFYGNHIMNWYLNFL